MAQESGNRGEPRDTFREGVRAVTGILGALKDAIEETFEDLRDRGDLSPDRAREAARETVRRAQETAREAREVLDVVSRREFEALKAEVAALREELNKSAERGAAGASEGGEEPGQPPFEESTHGPGEPG